MANIDNKIKREPLLQRILQEVGDIDREVKKEVSDLKSNKILQHRDLIPQYEKEAGRTLIIYVAQIRNQKSQIHYSDIAPLGSMLSNCGIVDNLDLMLHSPGGSGEVAEKIVEMCREYTKKEFRVIVPNMAKSAGTLTALGADKIVMGYCSELGPIDAQVPIVVSGMPRHVSAISVIRARDNLIQKIEEERESNKNYAGYFQQLSLIDPVFVEECIRGINFAIDFVMKWLPAYMLKDVDKREEIAKTIATNLAQLSPQDDRFTHGRMIGAQEARKMGLKIDYLKKDDSLWNILWEIYLRSEVFLMLNNTKERNITKLFFDKSSFLLAN